MKTNYNRTVQACFIGYVVQAIVNNFVPLLFLTFQGSYGISLQKITLLVTFNFGIQLLVDLASIGFVDRIGYRASMILAHAMAAAGLILLTVLPESFQTLRGGWCGSLSDFAHSIAGVPGRYVCGTYHCSYDLCHRRRIAGGAGKSCGGSLPYR